MSDERDLLALLCDELEEAEERQLRRRLQDDAVLAARFERLRSVWEELELPPPPPLPDGFAHRLRREIERGRRGEGELAWRLAPRWARWAASAALAAGLALGVGLGTVGASERHVDGELEWRSGLGGETLAEAYWLSVAELEESSP